MLKRLLRLSLFPAVLLIVLGGLALYIVWSGDSSVTTGNYTPDKAKDYFESLPFETGLPDGAKQTIDGTAWYLVSGGDRETSLWLEPESGRIAVKDAHGTMWYGNPTSSDMEREEVQGLWRANLQSPFLFRYLKPQQNSPELSNAVEHNAAVAWRKINGGVGVRYVLDDLGFSFYFEYRLNNGELQVHMPELGLLETKENKIVTVELLPFMGAAPSGTEGYLFVPDGPGGLIYFNKTRSPLVTAYDFPVYGIDPSIPPNGQFFPRDSIAYPVFGLKRGDAGFLAVIEEGQYKSNVYAAPSGIHTGFNQIFARFHVRRPFKQPISLTKSIDAYEKNMTVEPITVKYMFLKGEEANYVGMAKAYRNYLQKEAGAAKLQGGSKEPPAYFEFIMAATEPNPFNTKTVVSTTFEQVEQIVEKLRGRGVGNMIVGVTGWNRGGLQGSLPKRFPIEEGIGGADGLKRLSGKLEAMGDAKLVMQDVFTQSTNAFGNGFSPLEDAARMVDGTAYREMFWSDWYSKETYYYRPNAENIRINVEQALEQYKRLPVDGIGIAEFGGLLYSDFSRKHPQDRKTMANMYAELLDTTRRTVGYAMTSGAGAYVLGHVDYIQLFPTVYNYDLIIDEEVPFYPIAVHGLATYSAAPGNVRTNPEVEYLRAIEYGEIPYFMLTYEDPRVLKRTMFAYLFSSKFDALEDRVLEEYEAFVDASEGVWNLFIENHRKVADGVYETTYENGRKIWVNYNQVPYSGEGHTMDAHSFAVIERGVSG
ncbi:DUF5696 domain-containing protein [Paenibacillus thermotolerans]|uniref:DUF5696 domain-containing protein n=1 Tax=Paenibacillus thermotolerans TaxID=3027807 RepID=UPI002367C4C9|nr:MULTISPECIES: DUF5696 domain-containing protein [unclassified Paenibacillus]